jgi:hypothetical protein
MPSIAIVSHRAWPAIAALALIAPVAGAQDTLVAGDRVRLRLVAPREDPHPRSRYEGPVVRLAGDTIALHDRRRTRAFALHDVRSVERRTQVRSAGAGALRWGIGSALVGAAAGAFAGAKVGGPSMCTLEPGGTCHDQDLLPTRGTAVVTGGVAGLLGAWYGATAGRWNWMRVAVPSAR